MKKLLAAACLLAAADARRGAAAGSPRRCYKPLGDVVADVLGRLLRPALQRADADQPDEREEPHAGVDAPARDRPRRRRRATGRAPRRSSSAASAHDFVRRRPRRSRARSCRSTACSTSRRRTTCGRSTRTTAASSGTTSGGRAAARTSATAASAMWRNYLFFVTPDDYLISLDARTGKERWHKEIASFQQQYFLTIGADGRSTTT